MSVDETYKLLFGDPTVNPQAEVIARLDKIIGLLSPAEARTPDVGPQDHTYVDLARSAAAHATPEDAALLHVLADRIEALAETVWQINRKGEALPVRDLTAESNARRERGLCVDFNASGNCWCEKPGGHKGHHWNTVGGFWTNWEWADRLQVGAPDE